MQKCWICCKNSTNVAKNFFPTILWYLVYFQIFFLDVISTCSKEKPQKSWAINDKFSKDSIFMGKHGWHFAEVFLHFRKRTVATILLHLFTKMLLHFHKKWRTVAMSTTSATTTTSTPTSPATTTTKSTLTLIFLTQFSQTGHTNSLRANIGLDFNHWITGSIFCFTAEHKKKGGKFFHLNGFLNICHPLDANFVLYQIKCVCRKPLNQLV